MCPSPLAVADKSNTNEYIDLAAEILSKSEQRRIVFTEIYKGKSKIKTVQELMESTHLSMKRVLEVGRYLATHDIVFQIKVNNRIAYEKNPFYQHYRDRILRLAGNSKARQKVPTKRRVQFTEGALNLEPKININQVPPSKSLTINIGDKATVSNLVVSDSIENSFNKIESAEISDQLKSLLRNLAEAVQLVIAESSQAEAEVIARDLEIFTAEVTSNSPREPWYRMSAEGLEKAANRVGAIGKPVLELATLVMSLISP
jgi:hypothetical protein